jgi:Na+/H+ antiporter NhaD/arsenite permease-like protein
VDYVVLAIFAATYFGLALGRFPYLAIDRTGVALLGAAACLATGAIDLESAKDAVDAPTIVLLFGMMVLSAQYRLSGLYTAITDRLVGVADPARLLAGTILAAGLLAAVLTNDVVCFVLTPLLAESLLRAGRDPVPYLLALAAATNLGSAATSIGNPQNIVISQSLGLPFGPFFLSCAPTAVVSLVVLYALLVRRVRVPAGPGFVPAGSATRQELDRWQAKKALLLTVLAIAVFLTPVPPALTALAVAGVILLSRRMHTRAMLALVDWHLLALFVGLFVVLAAFERAGWTRAAHELLAGAGLDLAAPLLLVPVVTLLSNVVSNVPAVMLLLPFLPGDPATGHVLALSSTYAGNLVLVGSIANLIVAEQAARLGIPITLRVHLRVGLPITVVSLALVVLQALLLG